MSQPWTVPCFQWITAGLTVGVSTENWLCFHIVAHAMFALLLSNLHHSLAY